MLARAAVQETYARWYALSAQQQEAIENLGAWLTTVAIQTAASALYAIPDRRGQGCKPCVSTSQRPLNPGLEATGR